VSLLLPILTASALARPLSFDRIDLLSEDPGTFVDEQVARATHSPTVTGIRYAEQLKLVVALPWEPVTVGLSAATQSVYLEPRLTDWGLGLTLGLQTRLLLPRGGLVGLHLRRGIVRVGLGANVLSAATYTRPAYDHWRVLPGVGFGLGRRAERAQRAPTWGDPLER
jgi:hypothetical protein